MTHGMHDSRRVPDRPDGCYSYTSENGFGKPRFPCFFTMDSMEHRAWMLDVYHGAWLIHSLRSAHRHPSYNAFLALWSIVYILGIMIPLAYKKRSWLNCERLGAFYYVLSPWIT